jgi:cell wall-associated NlpC family hydrolase
MSDEVVIPAYATHRQRFLAELDLLLGKPVLWGAKGPDSFDCSGAVTWAIKQVGGPDLRHLDTAQVLYNETRLLMPVAEKPLAGDLVFYGFGPTSVIHVATVDEHGGVISADGATPDITSMAVTLANPANRVRRHPVINYRRDTPFVQVHRNTIVDQLDQVSR